MNNIEKQLNNLPKGRLSRRADFSIRYKLMKAGLQQKFSGLNFNFLTSARLRPVMAVLVILVLVFSSVTSAYAYNSDQVTRASMLYPVKRGLEQIESQFATTPAAQVRLHNKFAERRIAEAQFLSDIGSASSTEADVPVKLRHENEFNDTLSDADNEIDQANIKVGEIGDRTELDQSLSLLSDSHLEDLDKIKAMAEGIGLGEDDRTTDNIALVLDDIKGHQQRIVRAISQFNGDLKKAGEDDESDEDATSTVNTVISTTTEANNSLDRVKSDINQLQNNLSQNGRVSTKQIKRLTDRLNKKINQAETAIENGDLNKFNGLLKATEALTNNGQHFLRENGLEIKTDNVLPASNTSETTIKAQYSQKELLKKQAEQRKKLEEQRKEESKKSLEQDQKILNTEDGQTATSSINILPEQKTGGGSSSTIEYRSSDEHTASSTPPSDKDD
jgi:hypothetical protein